MDSKVACSGESSLATIKLTSKRQATFPRAVCKEMDVKPGDALTLEQRVVDGERVWILRPEARSDAEWFGCLRSYARGKPHGMAAIRKSIREARKRGRS